MHTLTIERTFNAPLDRVWEAWTNPEVMRQWMCPHGFVIESLSGEPTVGGAWEETMDSEVHGKHTLRGVYKVIEPKTRIVSSVYWVQENGSNDTEMEYTVLLREAGEKTVMTFTQTGFASVESRDSHEGGWGECFEKLTEIVK